jgi:hypothetical protein
MLPMYDSARKLYSELWRINWGEIDYKIYFYKGASKESVADKFPIVFDGETLTQEQYALKIAGFLDIFNRHRFDITVRYTGFLDTQTLQPKRESNEGVVMVYNGLSMCFMNKDSFHLRTSHASNTEGLRGNIVHEFQHALGLMHSKGRTGSSRYNSTKTIKYGNPFYQNLEFSRGKELSRETINSLNILYDVETPVKIVGNVDNKYKQYYQDGYAEAFLISKRNKDVENHAIIDSEGYFEFRPESSLEGKYDLLVTSSHINWNFIDSIKDAMGEWEIVCAPEGGMIYWGKINANYRSVKNDEILLKNVPMGKSSGSIRAIEKGIGVRLRKNPVRKIKKE